MKLNPNQAKVITKILTRYVKWYNHTIDEFGFMPGANLEEQSFRMWLEYNCKEELNRIGFDTLFKCYQESISFVGVPDDATYSAWCD